MSTTPSWDLFITLFFIIAIAYGFMLQREKIVATMVSVYVALVISQIFGGTVYQFLQGDKTIFGSLFVRSSASPFTVQTLVFLAVIVLLTMRSGLAAARAKGILSPIELFGYSFLTAGLIVSSILSFMPAETRTAIVQQSHLIKRIVDLQIWWLILPVIGLVVTGSKRSSSSE